MPYYGEYEYNKSSSSNAFATASVILGGIAIASFSLILPSVFAGSLAIVFAMLSRKGTGRLSPTAKAGTICSAISITLGIALFSFYLNYIPQLLQNDEYRSEMKYMLESVYGTEMNVDSFLDAIENKDFLAPLSEQ